MELTKDFLTQELAAMRAQLQQKEADAYAQRGAIQVLEQLLARLDASDADDVITEASEARVTRLSARKQEGA